MQLKTLLANRDALLAGILLLLILLVGLKNPTFLGLESLTGTLNDTSILIILALGQMLVILTRCIDLSIAANVALTGMVVAMLNASMPGIPVFVLILIAMLLGTVLGMLNGLLVWKLNIPAIVVTLGTMSVYRGVIFLLSNGEWVNAHQMSKDFIDFPRNVLLGLPVMTWIAVGMTGLMFYLLKFRRWGRNFYTAGGNPTAAFYTGIDVGRSQFNAFMFAGMLGGLCGYLWVSRFAVAYVDVANGFELQVIAACVIGGISIAGGIGTVFGCLLGALFIGVINNALPIIGISPFWQMAISGSVIILAVIVNSRSERKVGRNILRQPHQAIKETQA
ncbi:MAG: ABC transporter permease [Reinekea sp.]|jgi:rhamnose transport system permease protein